MTDSTRIVSLKTSRYDPVNPQRILAYGSPAALAAMNKQLPIFITDEEVAAILATGFIPKDNDWENDPAVVATLADFLKAKAICEHLRKKSGDLSALGTKAPRLEQKATWAALDEANEAVGQTTDAYNKAKHRAKGRTEALVNAYIKPLIEQRKRELLAEAEEATE